MHQLNYREFFYNLFAALFDRSNEADDDVHRQATTRAKHARRLKSSRPFDGPSTNGIQGVTTSLHLSLVEKISGSATCDKAELLSFSSFSSLIVFIHWRHCSLARKLPETWWFRWWLNAQIKAPAGRTSFSKILEKLARDVLQIHPSFKSSQVVMFLLVSSLSA